MGSIVRRVSQEMSAGEETSTQHDGEHLSIVSHLCLGVYPGIRLEWTIGYRVYHQARLMGFRSTSGFCAEDQPDDLTDHGQMFLETNSDGEMEQKLPEGTYYYTFLLQQSAWHGLSENRSRPVRFSETIPSAKVAIGRMEDQVKYRQLAHELSLQDTRDAIARTELEARLKLLTKAAEPKKIEAPRRSVRVGFSAFKKKYDDVVDAMCHATRLKEEYRKDKRFRKLSPEQQEELMRMIDEQNDPREQMFVP